MNWDRLSVLVNNAGAPGLAGNDWDVNPDDWWECIESIVRGAFLFNRAVVRPWWNAVREE